MNTAAVILLQVLAEWIIGEQFFLSDIRRQFLFCVFLHDVYFWPTQKGRAPQTKEGGAIVHADPQFTIVSESVVSSTLLVEFSAFSPYVRVLAAKCSTAT